MNKIAIWLSFLLISTAVDAALPALGDPLLAGRGYVANNPPVQSSGQLNLPSLGEPVPADGGLVPMGSGSLQVKGSLDGDRYTINQDFTNPSGALLDVDMATRKIPQTTVGWLVSAQPNKAETVMNLGWRFGDNQQLLVSAARLRSAVQSDVGSRINPVGSQITSGVDYRYFLGQHWLSGIDLSGYTSSSPSQSTQDSQDHLAGTNLYGVMLGLEASPLQGSQLKIGLGTEHVVYDSLTSSELVQNLNTSVKWSQVLWPSVKYSASVVDNATQRNVSTGLDINLSDGQQLGIQVERTQYNDGQTSDHGVQLTYSLQFGSKSTPFQTKSGQTPWNASLFPEVMQRPAYLPETVLSRPDSRLN